MRAHPAKTRVLGLFFVLTAAAVLRLLLSVQNFSMNPLSRIPMVDAAIHHEMAVKISQGNLIQDRPFERPPLYAYFVAGIYTIFGPSPRAVAVIQALIGLLGLWLLYRVGRFYLSPRSALMGVALAAFYGPLAFFELKLLPASLSVFLVLLFLYFLVSFMSNKRMIWALVSGLMGGFLILDRPNLVFLPIFVVLWLIFGKAQSLRKAGWVLALGVVLAASPAWVHNIAAGDGTVLVCAGGGFNFYLGHHKGGEASFTQSVHGSIDPGAMPETSLRVYQRERGSPPQHLAQVEWFWIKKGLKEISEDPLGWCVLQLGKIKALFSEFEYGINYSYSAEKEILRVLHLFFIPFSLLAALGITGALFCLRKTPKISRFPLIGVLIAVLISAWVFFTYSRFRLPAVPVLSLLGGEALASMITASRNGRIKTVIRFFIPGVVVMVLSLLPSGYLARRQLSAGHALLGASFFRCNDIPRALASYERAITADPGSVKSLQTLAEILAASGDYPGAWAKHQIALEVRPHDPWVLSKAALFLITAPPPYNQVDVAESMARMAAEADPLSPWSNVCLGMIRHVQGREEESEKEFQEAITKSQGDPSVLRMMAGWYRSLGRIQEGEDLERIIMEQTP